MHSRKCTHCVPSFRQSSQTPGVFGGGKSPSVRSLTSSQVPLAFFFDRDWPILISPGNSCSGLGAILRSRSLRGQRQPGEGGGKNSNADQSAYHQDPADYQRGGDSGQRGNDDGDNSRQGPCSLK